jgi:hypothetical protein
MNCHAQSAPGTLFMPQPDVPSSVEPKVGVILKPTFAKQVQGVSPELFIVQETAPGPVDLDGIDVAPSAACRSPRHMSR